jgi:hypothetical protein
MQTAAKLNSASASAPIPDLKKYLKEQLFSRYFPSRD